MKKFSAILKLGIYPLFFGASVYSLKAQTVDSTTIRLWLNEAIRYAKGSNKLIGVLKTEECATQLDLDDAKMGALPRILSNASYQRYSKVTLYEGVLGDSRKITKPPNANAGALGLETSFNLYAGGRQRYVIADEHAVYFGVELDDTSLVTGKNARIGKIKYEDWFNTQLAKA